MNSEIVYHEPEKFEVLAKNWLEARLKELQTPGFYQILKDKKRVRAWMVELEEDVENLIAWGG